jgi:ribosomal 50S subunit-associated protein YjgA (DUF615 family)
MVSVRGLSADLREEIDPLLALLDMPPTTIDQHELKTLLKAAVSDAATSLVRLKNRLLAADPLGDETFEVIKQQSRLQDAAAAIKAAQVSAIARRMREQAVAIGSARDDLRARVATIRTVAQAVEVVTSVLALAVLFV